MSSGERSGKRREAGPPTANDRLKRSWSMVWAAATLVAAVAHAATLALWPGMPVRPEWGGAGKWVAGAVPMVGVSRTGAPASPVARARPTPPAPLEVAAVGPMELALESVADPPPPELFDAMVGDLPEPALRGAEAASAALLASFVPAMVRPRLRNEAEVNAFLRTHYPRVLYHASVGGEVKLCFWLDDRGEVRRVELYETSGFRSLDRLALRLSDVVEFTPAVRSGDAVPIEVVVPIVFRTN